jgi:drug/metabolite transporter (DMT)-like permease
MKKLPFLLALLTIAQWSFLAFLGSKLKHLPPFLLVGIALCVGSMIGLARLREWRVPWKTFAVGVYGIFGYHFLLFTAFQYAPAVEANLMNYLWPLLIVLLSPVFLRGFRLKPHHLLGALLGLAGAALIVTGGKLHLDIANLPGYLMAAGAAFVWSSYSLMTKRLPIFSTAAVAGFCLGSGVLSLAVYFVTGGELGQIFALNPADWMFLILMGLFPMGLAFFTWDAAIKRGDTRIIGSLAYITPLTSTLALVALGGRPFGWVSMLAMALIFSGAVVGSLDLVAAGYSRGDKRTANGEKGAG